MAKLVYDILRMCPNGDKIEFLGYYVTYLNCYVAGGCFKDIFENKRPKDIDLFFKNLTEYQTALDKIRSNNRFVFKNNTESTITFYDKITGFNIQLISKCFFENETKLLEDFDFTICRFCIFKDRYGLNVLRDIDYFTDLKDKRLSIAGDINTPIGTFKRAFKYSKYGFDITEESLKALGISIVQLDEDNEEVFELYYED